MRGRVGGRVFQVMFGFFFFSFWTGWSYYFCWRCLLPVCTGGSRSDFLKNGGHVSFLSELVEVEVADEVENKDLS